MAQATAEKKTTATVKRTAAKRKPTPKQTATKGEIPGVIGTAKSSYVTAKEVMFYLGCSRSKAYNVMSDLRQELVDAGQMYGGINRLPKHYFFERCMIDENDYL